VLAFITNRNFVEKAAFDGFRRDLADEFTAIHVVDLGGDVRVNPKLSGTKHNVFGIQTGVAIVLLVKKRREKGCKVFYTRRPEMETAEDKLAWLGANKASALHYDAITPDKTQNWLHQTDNDWDTLLPIASKAAKAGKLGSKNQAIFQLFSSGLKTQRDEWAYDPDKATLEAKMRYFVETYDATRKDKSFAGKDTIKWDAELERYAKTGIAKAFNAKSIVRSAYRPFTSEWVYFDSHFNGRTYQLPVMFPAGKENKFIAFPQGGRLDFCAFSDSRIPNLTMLSLDANQCLPRYRYTTEGERIDNITDWALAQFHKAYGKTGASSLPLAGRVDGEAGREGGAASPERLLPPPDPALRAGPPSPRGGGMKTVQTLTKDAIFHYVYAVLHDPLYREKYAQNLKREFPRLPFYPDFWQWAAWGEKLMALHIGYETQEPWPLERRDVPDVKARTAGLSPSVKLRADRDAGIITLDSETVLSGIPKAVWEYKLGNRSALDWILDQHKEKTPKDATIREKFNTYRFADYKEKVVDLLMRVTRVSVETVAITEAMKLAKR
jgi:predicted helicase